MWISEGLAAVLWNVVGGAIVAGLSLLFPYVKRQLRHLAFRRIFGSDVENIFYIVYPAVHSPSSETVFEKPPSLVPRRTSAATRLTDVHSTAVTRAVNHLSFEIGHNSKKLPRIMSDVDADSSMDISYISIGGLTNHKTVDLLDDKNNEFIDFASNTIVSKASGFEIFKMEQGFDYGMIMKINPSNNQKRTWLCCAGLGEWGTSGAAWWFSQNWKEIHKKVKKKPFACITQTKIGIDDSTQKVRLFQTSEEVKKAILSE